jgi:ribosomal protein S18 acetylase RimI-like enzyme
MCHAPDMEDDQATTIRPAREQDRVQVLALAPRPTEGAAIWRCPDAVLTAATGWLDTSLDAALAESAAMYVACVAAGDDPADPERVVGVISVGRDRHFTGDDDAYIGELAVAPDAIRTGVGRRLVRAAESWARGGGLRRVSLHTGAATVTARAFYDALGFREEDVRLPLVLEPPGDG